MNGVAGTIRGIAPVFDRCPLDDLAGYAVERFTKRQIVRAGKLIAGSHSEANEELVAAFSTAHAWRAAHIYPMRLVRAELARFSRKLDADAITAGRLKRMSSIRRKLKANRTLYQIQDISGCRAIMGSMDEVRALQRLYDGGRTRHAEVIDRDDYIESPKPEARRLSLSASRCQIRRHRRADQRQSPCGGDTASHASSTCVGDSGRSCRVRPERES